jgi:hypothetical protein
MQAGFLGLRARPAATHHPLDPVQIEPTMR